MNIDLDMDKPLLKQAEYAIIIHCLRLSENNKLKTAKLLGIDARTLRDKLNTMIEKGVLPKGLVQYNIKKNDRSIKMVEMFRSGVSCKHIGEFFNISQQNVRATIGHQFGTVEYKELVQLNKAIIARQNKENDNRIMGKIMEMQ